MKISSNDTIFLLVVYVFPECVVQHKVCSTTYLASIHPCQMSVWVSFHFRMPKSMDTRARRHATFPQLEANHFNTESTARNEENHSNDDVMSWKHFPHYWWHFVGETTGGRWIPITKSSKAEFLCFLYVSVNNLLDKQSHCRWIETPWRSRDVNLM